MKKQVNENLINKNDKNNNDNKSLISVQKVCKKLYHKYRLKKIILDKIIEKGKWSYCCYCKEVFLKSKLTPCIKFNCENKICRECLINNENINQQKKMKYSDSLLNDKNCEKVEKHYDYKNEMCNSCTNKKNNL